MRDFVGEVEIERDYFSAEEDYPYYFGIRQAFYNSKLKTDKQTLKED